MPGRDYSISTLDRCSGDIPVHTCSWNAGEAHLWAPFFVEASPRVHLVAIDRPGFGESGPDDAVPSLVEQAEAVLAVIRSLNKGPAILVAHSYGGPIVVRAAIKEPASVASLVLLASSFDPTLEQAKALQQALDGWPAHLVLPRRLRNANKELLALNLELSHLSDRLGEVVTPVTIVHGTKDDLIPMTNVEYLSSRLTGSRLLTTRLLEGQGHFLPMKARQDVLKIIDAAIDVM
ncbi:MAG: alpha/beta fold hydrolase [Rhizomicrobium sp.]